MKQPLFLRRAAALLLSATLLPGLAGCSKAEASAPASVENSPAQSMAALPAQSKLPVQATPSAPTEQAETPDDGGLAEVRKTALEAAPDAAFVVAYLEATDINDIGYSSTDNFTVNNYDFIGEIDRAHRIDVSDGTRDPEVYCIFPLDPNAGLAVNLMESETGRPGKEVYRAATGEPILLCCNGESEPNARVSISVGDRTEEFVPSTDAYWGERRISQQGGLNYYDFTRYASWEEDPVPAIPPAGTWLAEVPDKNNPGGPVIMYLHLWPEDGAAEILLEDAATRESVANYSGTWEKKDDKTITLELESFSTSDGNSAYDAPIEGDYLYTLEPDGSMIVSLAGKGSSQLYAGQGGNIIYLWPEDNWSGPGGEDYATCQTVLNWYEATTGYRPEYANVDSVQNGELLIRLYDDMGTHILTDGWFLINPDTLQGSNYVSEEEIDFSGY